MLAVSIIANLLGPLEERLEKIASAGTISYAPREEGRTYDYTADKREGLWREFDEDPAVTGEESSLGMPSAGGINKTSGLEDGQYGQKEGPYAQGGFDANQNKSDRDHRLSSAMQESFKALDEYDPSFGPESPATQPHGGPKYANTKKEANVAYNFRMPPSIPSRAPKAEGVLSRWGQLLGGSRKKELENQLQQIDKLPTSFNFKDDNKEFIKQKVRSQKRIWDMERAQKRMDETADILKEKPNDSFATIGHENAKEHFEAAKAKKTIPFEDVDNLHEARTGYNDRRRRAPRDFEHAIDDERDSVLKARLGTGAGLGALGLGTYATTRDKEAAFPRPSAPKFMDAPQARKGIGRAWDLLSGEHADNLSTHGRKISDQAWTYIAPEDIYKAISDQERHQRNIKYIYDDLKRYQGKIKKGPGNNTISRLNYEDSIKELPIIEDELREARARPFDQSVKELKDIKDQYSKYYRDVSEEAQRARNASNAERDRVTKTRTGTGLAAGLGAAGAGLHLATRDKEANATAMGLGAGMNPQSLTKGMNPATFKMPKLPKVTDPRAPGLPAHHNLQHAVQGNAYAGNAGQSLASPEMRMMGSPV